MDSARCRVSLALSIKDNEGDRIVEGGLEMGSTDGRVGRGRLASWEGIACIGVLEVEEGRVEVIGPAVTVEVEVGGVFFLVDLSVQIQ